MSNSRIKRLVMTNEFMDNVINIRVEHTVDILSKKALEYVRNNDRLHNFNVGAELENKTREEVLHSFFLKHYISYLDMLEDIKNDKLPKKSYVDEKMGDMINYLILQEASIKQKIIEKEREISESE